MLTAQVSFNQLLLTVLGFVVGLSLSFRSSTAYERYSEGRKYWAQLAFVSQHLARLIWVHAEERHKDPEVGKKDLLGKISCLNMITAFAMALKHKLRFEPYANYEDLGHIVGHLDTYARAVSSWVLQCFETTLTTDEAEQPAPPRKQSVFKTAGQFLGLPFAESNPRKLIKKSKVPLVSHSATLAHNSTLNSHWHLNIEHPIHNPQRTLLRNLPVFTDTPRATSPSRSSPTSPPT